MRVTTASTWAEQYIESDGLPEPINVTPGRRRNPTVAAYLEANPGAFVYTETVRPERFEMPPIFANALKAGFAIWIAVLVIDVVRALR